MNFCMKNLDIETLMLTFTSLRIDAVLFGR